MTGNGVVSNLICRRDRRGRIGTTIGASSAVLFTCCNRGRHAVIVRANTVLTRRPTIASIAGPSANDGAQSFKHRPNRAKMPSCCRSTRLRSKLIGVPPAEKGEHNQAIGRSRGGRTTKIHALSDQHRRPIVLLTQVRMPTSLPRPMFWRSHHPERASRRQRVGRGQPSRRNRWSRRQARHSQ
ncbi:hypothetical protein ABIC02_007362 [Bradyrhizobium sp. RT5a]